MGSYAECWLDSLYIGSTKNDFDSDLMRLFRRSDKRLQRCAVKELPRPLRNWTDDLEDPEEKVDVVYYIAAAPLVKDRLELTGYTLDTAKRAFMKRMRAEAKEYAKWAEREEYNNKAFAEIKDGYESKAKLLKALDVDEWLAAFRHIKEAGLGTSTRGMRDYGREVDLEGFMLQNDWYGFSGVDLNVPLRLALETCTERDNFIYDLSDLVGGGYFDKKEDFVALASEFAAGEHTSHSKIVILTEGPSDGWILSESMKVLYPHLADYFTFMDFEAAKVEGGASPLSKIVKSFAGAGIANKVIAIFDNDTAGQDAIRSLRNINLPGNLSVLKLPELKALRRYPTIGPSGPKDMNVNGLAASIELYLGEDVLRENGRLTPVKWSAYINNMGQYQGEVLDKDKIHKRFKEKLARHMDGPNLTQDQNWAGLCAIMSSIFSAFHRFDRNIIFAERLENYPR
jgi:hypothetical protein